MSKLFDDASLAMIPSAYKDGKLYSIRPTDGSGDFTFSRGSNLAATRVDVNGLIEKGRENVLLQSNQFDTTWINVSTTETGGQADKDGGNTAWKLQNTATAGRIQQGTFSAGVYTMSVYAKAGDVNWIQLYADETTTGNDPTCYFDLQNGVVGTSTYIIDKSIEFVGGGWYRCSMSFNAIGTYSYLIFNSQDDNVRANSGEFTYIQDAQLEQGLVATNYIETGTSAAQSGILEDMPRLDYSGSCPSLLLEPQRTNLLTHSEYFGGWNVISQGTGSAPSLSIGGDFPLGDGKYYNLQCDLNGGTTSSDRSYITLGGLSGTQFTAAKSLWIKNNSASEVSLFAGINFSADEFTLAANADWQRITIEGGVINSEFRIGLGGGASNSDSIDVSIFGAQCEAGSYPTSYIPTYGTSQTRSEDEAGTSAISGLVGANGGSLFIEISYPEFNSNSRFSLSDGTYDNLIYSRTQTSGRIQFLGGDLLLQAPSGFASLNTFYKVAIGFEENNAVMYIDGVQIDTDTSFTMPSGLDSFIFGQTNASINPLRADVKQVLIFPTRLTNAELAALTA